MTHSLLHRVAEIVAGNTGASADTIVPDTGPDDIEDWDSFAQLNIMMALEDEFGVQLAPEDVDLMQSVGAIVALIEARTA
jgi:acyl carrier protein